MFLLVMPFSLRNAGNTFQCLMNQILGDLPFCFVYVDNIVVFRAQNLRQGIIVKTSFETRVSRMGLGSFVNINISVLKYYFI